MPGIDIQNIKAGQRQQWLQHAIAPRPIAFASTIDKAGNVNLSPFSFFNMFSAAPPIVIFSPSRRVRDNTTKHTLQNILEVPEVVIHICDYDMVQQVSLASCEFPKGTMVKEAKVKMECKVLEIKSLGETAGAGQLVIAEVLYMHVDESILNEGKDMIDQLKFHQVARLGGNWYSVVNENNLFQVEKPNTQIGIGVDAIPPSIKNSKILSGNHLGMLGNVHEQPEIDPAFEDEQLKSIF